MKLIHISDLHIGKKVNSFSMLENQIHVLKQIVEIIKEEMPAAVLVSGDVYDKMNPSEEAVRCMDEFLVQLSRLPAEVFVLSGNHDSAERIAFASRLIDASGIHMCPVFKGETNRYSLSDEYGVLNIYMLPYIKPVHIRRFFPGEKAETASDAVRIAVEKMNINTCERNVIMSHQFVTGSVIGETELNVGGLDEVSAGCYEAFDYAALGHIHSPQNVVKNKIRYCGTPLKYSFEESSQVKSLTIVDIKEKGNVEVSERMLTPLYDFIKIEGAFADIMNAEKNQTVYDYVEVTLTDELDIPDAFRRLETVFPNLMKLKYNNRRTRRKREAEMIPEASEISEIKLIEQFYELQNNIPLSELQREYVNEIIKKVREDMQ